MIRRASIARGVERLFLCAGMAALSYAGGTVAYASIYQRYESRTFARTMAVRNDGIPAAVARAPRDGDVIGRLEIPRLHLSVMVFHGVDAETLVRGAGHVPGTPLPGVVGNVAIAAHRDTFFRALAGVRAGDAVQLSTRLGSFDYVVDRTETVSPDDTAVIESRGRSELTLITCYPFSFVGAAPERFIVHARPHVPAR